MINENIKGEGMSDKINKKIDDVGELVNTLRTELEWAKKILKEINELNRNANDDTAKMIVGKTCRKIDYYFKGLKAEGENNE